MGKLHNGMLVVKYKHMASLDLEYDAKGKIYAKGNVYMRVIHG